ncbi:PDC sensor domain-containing protein [Thiorhodovibrio litoralis]|uniref:PDC sensor domain-containing protein n=1 Tax=Thiorhodovibrio litoralis TaxID=2952932 RepID=UPI002B25878B|nr:PDC sensor domain-containing protein [Thiorhodovibrio litoralis]WPL12678.1 hypothetical protein Thiosp_02452 [Thiorhodovibrio litoralis]
MMDSTLKGTIHRQREAIARTLHEPIAQTAAACVAAWSDRGQLNDVLMDCCRHIPSCGALFVVDRAGRQISDTISAAGAEPADFGRDRSTRPYMREAVPAWGFLLSDAYVGLVSHRPSLTALHVVRRDWELLGYVGATFNLKDLPVTAKLYEDLPHWLQIKGDPSIRNTVLLQTRVESPIDQNLDQVLSVIEELLVDRGMFQGVVHFSSSRATVWTVDDPFRYRILDHEALSDPDICLVYPSRAYSAEAVIPQASISPILNALKELRLMDDTFYLRSASLNLFNGMISLTFSCDGTHYMRYDEFLEKNLTFWVGNGTA